MHAPITGVSFSAFDRAYKHTTERGVRVRVRAQNHNGTNGTSQTTKPLVFHNVNDYGFSYTGLDNVTTNLCVPTHAPEPRGLRI